MIKISRMFLAFLVAFCVVSLSAVAQAAILKVTNETDHQINIFVDGKSVGLVPPHDKGQFTVKGEKDHVLKAENNASRKGTWGPETKHFGNNQTV